MKYVIGDAVEWSSQAQGITKRKSGVVVSVVPPEQRPDRMQFDDLYRGPGCGYGRPHESYVVRVGNKHYWPRVSALRASKACPACKGTGLAP